MSGNGGKIMRQITVNGTRKRSDQPIADLEHPKVNLNSHPQVKDGDLERRGQLFHVSAGRGDEQTLVFDEEVPFQLFRDISRISAEESSEFLVHLAENGSVVRVARRQFEAKNAAFDVSRKMKLEAVEKALGAFGHRRQCFHGSVMPRVLQETCRQFGGVGKLDGVSLSSEKVNDGGDDSPEIFPDPIERNDKPIVGAGRFKNFIERFLGGNVLPLLEDNRRNNLGVGEEWFPTFDVFPFVEFQCAEEL